MHKSGFFNLMRGALTMTAICLSTAVQGGENPVVSWTGYEAGPLSERWAGIPNLRWNGHTYLASARGQDIEVLSATSEKGALFGSAALRVGLVQGEGGGTFALRGRPFLKPALKGELEFQLAVESGKVRINLGQNPTPFEEGHDQTVILPTNDVAFGITLEAEGYAMVEKVSYYTKSAPVLKSGQPYKLRISWDFESATPHFSASLDGEPLVNIHSGEPLSFPAQPEMAARGIDSFTLVGVKNTECRYIVGNILSTEP